MHLSVAALILYRFIAILTGFLLLAGSLLANGHRHLELADSLQESGDYDGAFIHYQKAAKEFKDKGLWEDYAWAEIWAGNTFQAREELQEAIDYYLAAIDAFAGLSFAGNEFFIAVVNQKIGISHWEIQDFPSAEKRLIASLSYLEHCDQTANGCYVPVGEYLWYSYYYLSVVYSAVFDQEKAENFARKCVSLVEQDEVLFQKYGPYSYRELGRIFVKFHQYQKGVGYLRGLLEKDVRIATVKEAIFLDLGLCYAELGKYDSATYFHKAYLDLASRRNDTYALAKAYEFIGYDFFKTARYDSAHFYFSEALRIKQELPGNQNTDIAHTFNLLGRNYFKSGQLDSALYHYQKAISANLLFFDNMSITSNPPASKVNTDKNLTTVILFNKGEALLKKYKSGGGRNYLEYALNTFVVGDSVLESTRRHITEDSKLLLADSMNTLYGQALNCVYELYRAGQTERAVSHAIQFMERSKSRILSENLQYIKKSGEGSAESDSLRSIEKSLTYRIDSLKKILINIENNPSQNKDSLKMITDELFELDRQKSRIVASYKHENDRLLSPDLLTIQALQDYCKTTNSAIIDFTWTYPHLFILSVNEREVHFDRLPIDESLLMHINRFIANVSTGVSYTSLKNYRELASSGHFLYQNLIREEVIEGAERFIVIPDNLLSKIPFEALITTQPQMQAVDYKNLDYLVRELPVMYTYSLNYLLMRRDPGNDKYDHIGAFSYQDGPETGGNNDQLVGSSKEVDAINRTFRRVKLFKGEKATEENFKKHAPYYNVLHLALHAAANPRNQYASSLLFRHGGQMEDGNLFTYEIYNMDINASLVVLSACETGLGEYKTGEGAYSVARGFALAGAPSVVMSLWEVNDHSSAGIMDQFYKKLRDKHPVDQSLRMSKLVFLQKADEYTAHPNNWAAYVVTGTPVKVKAISWGLIAAFALVAMVFLAFFYFRRTASVSIFKSVY